MLHSFMIISGRGGIVLYRKTLTRVLNQPRLIAGLVTAMCEFSTGSISLPISTIELSEFTVSVVEIPADDVDADREYLRGMFFHDHTDGDLYGHVVGLELLTCFKKVYGERLLSMQLANVQGVEESFKSFDTRVRGAILNSIHPLLESLESHEGIKNTFLLRHKQDGEFSKGLEKVWYPSSGTMNASLLSDVEALLSAGDDVMACHSGETIVVTVGNHIRIERLSIATLVVVTQKGLPICSYQEVISEFTKTLNLLFVLMQGLEGSRGVT